MVSRRGSKLSRRTSTRDLVPRLLVVCEGKTEKKILCELRGHYRIPSVSVEVLGQVGVPKTIVEKAKEKTSSFDEVWVAFDRDEHPEWKGSIEKALRLKMRIAVSNPCVELWGLLLHGDQGAYLEREKAQSALSKVHPKYHHEKNPYFELEDVLQLAAGAHRRAELLIDSRITDDDPFGNPSTRFHLLVARVIELGRMIEEGS